MKNSILHIEANLLSRLERMPLNPRLLGIAAMLTCVWVMEAFDLGIIGQVILVLKKIWMLEPSSIGLLASSSTIGVVVGTASAGFLTDRFGRKKVLLYGVSIFSFFTLIGAAHPSIGWIVTMRFIGGLGAGAVFPLPYLMLSEISPGKYRGLMVCMCNAVLTASYFLPTLVGSWAINNFALETAWKIPFIVGGVPLLSLFFIYKFLPESPRWLMKNNRHDEVRVLVESLEKSAHIEHDNSYMEPAILKNLQSMSDADDRRGKLSWKAVVTPPLLQRSLMSWTLYIAGLMLWYVVMVYVPTILSTYGFDTSLAVIMTGYMIIIGGIGTLVVGPFVDYFGRKPTCTLFIGITIVCLVLMAAGSLTHNMVLLVGAAVSFFGVGILPVFKVYVAEQYPTELRGVGTGFGEATARVCSGVLATYFFAYFMSLGGIPAIFIVMAVTFFIALLGLWFYGRETARRSVEEVSTIENN